jgi:predicted N-formylglutamate amidohydrolase
MRDENTKMTEGAQTFLPDSEWDTETSHELLAPGEPSPVGIREGIGQPRMLVICDHASNLLPASLAGLGVDAARLGEHIAYDLGALGVARGVAEQFGAPFVFGRYSRLAADLNRAPGDASAVPAISDGVLVPGNVGLTPDERMRRIRALHDPYHAHIANFIAGAMQRGIRPILVSIHSFTPTISRIKRPWEAGVLWDKDPRVAIPLLAALRREGVLVGDNEPYSGRHTADYTLDRHAEGNHLAHAAIEIRQDCILSAGSQHIWAERLARVLKPIVANEALHAAPLEGAGSG